MSARGYDLAAIGLLWRRELWRLWRWPQRALVALGVPLVTWLVLRSGATLDPTAAPVDVGGALFPGALLLTMILAASYAALGVLEDRRDGWLSFVGSGPASPAALVLGECAGAATVVSLQSVLFAALAPLAGYGPNVDAPLLVGVCVLGSVGFAALTICIARVVATARLFHTTVALLLGLIWLPSGALFGPTAAPARLLMICSPGAWIVSALQHALRGASPATAVLTDSPLLAVGVVALFAAMAVAAALVAGTAGDRRSLATFAR